MVWRPRVDHGRKHETGDEDDGKGMKAPRSLRRYERRARAARQRSLNMKTGLDDQQAITEA